VVRQLEPLPIVIVDSITISAASSPLPSAVLPKDRVRAHFIGVNTLTDQLRLPHDIVEAVFQKSYCLPNEILGIGELIVVQQYRQTGWIHLSQRNRLPSWIGITNSADGDSFETRSLQLPGTRLRDRFGQVISANLAPMLSS
jgi:hypothetical protein